MKKIIAFIFLCFSQYIISQDILNPKFPKNVAISPEAASLGQFGGNLINIPFGSSDYRIPIYNIKVGDFNFPISLSYSYSGFKPDNNPTMVGMGWTANVSGAIIRQLNGLADESQSIGYFSQASIFENFNSISSEVQKTYLLQQAADGMLDTRPDKYIINTPTLSGSYRLKPNRIPVFSEPKNYLVNSDSYLDFFNIKDDSGVEYIFNEKEITTTWTFQASPEETSHVSSWMLKKINIPNSNQTIDFQYSTYNFGQSFISTQKVTTQNSAEAGDAGGVNTVLKYNLSDSNTISKLLNRVDFPNGYIVFNYNTAIVPYPNPYNSNSNFGTEQPKLQSIIVYSNSNEIIEKFKFDYYEMGYYFFLKSIKKEANNKIIDFYDFEYYDLHNIPSQKFTNNKMDLMGYYNNINYDSNNISSSLAPSFENAVIGALKKIKYPTKGNTEIKYELNSLFATTPTPEPQEPSPSTNICNPAYDSIEVSSEITGSSYESNEKTVIPCKIGLTKITLETDNSALDSYSDAMIYDEYNNVIHKLTSNRPANDTEEKSRYKKEVFFDYLSENKNYKIYVSTEGNNNYAGVHYAKVTLEYNVAPPLPVGQNLNGQVSGIRIKETIDSPNEELNELQKNTKKYYYPEGGYLTQRYPRFKISLSQIEGKEQQIESLYPTSTMTILGNHTLYPSIEIVNSDISIGTVKNNYKYFFPEIPIYDGSDFRFQWDEYVRRYINSPIPILPLEMGMGGYDPRYNLEFPELVKDNFKNFQLEKEVISENKNGIITEKRVTVNLYKDYNYRATDSVFDCHIIRHPYKIISETTGLYNDEFIRPHMEIIYHKTFASQLIKSTVEEKENNGIIETVKTQVYDPETSYLSEMKTINSKGNEIIDKMYYPNNSHYLLNLSNQNQLGLNNLIQKNIVSNPVEVQKVTNNNGNQLAKITQRTNFMNYGSNTLPESIQSSKNGNTLEDRIQYHNYYVSGNLKEASLKDGAHIIYLWGYNKQYPIAKIENTTNSQITSALGVSNLDSINESNLPAINALRTSLPNTMITTYTYKPLVGMTSMTDPKGYTTYYEYDEFNRLKSTKDAESKILSNYEYNYKQ